MSATCPEPDISSRLPHIISLKYILILSFRTCLGLHIWSVLFRCSDCSIYISTLPCVLIVHTISSSLCNFRYCRFAARILSPNMPLRNLLHLRKQLTDTYPTNVRRHIPQTSVFSLSASRKSQGLIKVKL